MDAKKSALYFVVLLGIVSLFADMTYEGARSITGPFLAIMGASATMVAIIAGFGELIGYGFRIVSGYISDRTRRYWTIALLGYAINLLAVPLLALAGRWEIAAFLMISERMGKAIRTPSRDTMLSHAGKEIGRGWGFALHEAMDQVGAMLGPLIVTGVLAYKGSYKLSFLVLGLPGVLALIVLITARIIYPNPQKFEAETVKIETRGFPRAFWIYLAASALVAAAYADFPLIAYHFKHLKIIEDKWIPLTYAGAMGVDALAALIFGFWYDRKGMWVIIVAVAVSCLFPILIFSEKIEYALIGMALWGIGMGAQESIMRAAVANMTPQYRRATGYGVFNTVFGVSWFAGSALMGVLYDHSIHALIAFSILAQTASLPLFLLIRESVGTKD